MEATAGKTLVEGILPDGSALQVTATSRQQIALAFLLSEMDVFICIKFPDPEELLQVVALSQYFLFLDLIRPGIRDP